MSQYIGGNHISHAGVLALDVMADMSMFALLLSSAAWKGYDSRAYLLLHEGMRKYFIPAKYFRDYTSSQCVVSRLWQGAFKVSVKIAVRQFFLIEIHVAVPYRSKKWIQY